TTFEDTSKRAFKVKNFLKELPTYEVLYRNNIFGIESAKCIRCNKTDETWDHIWVCGKNEINKDEDLTHEVLREMTNNENEEKIQIYYYAIINFLAEPSKVLKNGATKYREISQGLINRKFIEMGASKEHRN